MQGLCLLEGELPQKWEDGGEIWSLQQKYQQIQKTVLNTSAQHNGLAGMCQSCLLACSPPLVSPLHLVCLTPLQANTAHVGAEAPR